MVTMMTVMMTTAHNKSKRGDVGTKDDDDDDNYDDDENNDNDNNNNNDDDGERGVTGTCLLGPLTSFSMAEEKKSFSPHLLLFILFLSLFLSDFTSSPLLHHFQALFMSTPRC